MAAYANPVLVETMVRNFRTRRNETGAFTWDLLLWGFIGGGRLTEAYWKNHRLSIFQQMPDLQCNLQGQAQFRVFEQTPQYFLDAAQAIEQ